MKNKEKGFTLVELLAVIVILAVIALIAIPVILNLIESSRRGAAIATVNNYVKTVEKTIAAEKLLASVIVIIRETGTRPS